MHRRIGSLLGDLATHFQPGWERLYHQNKALYTWVDFFKFNSSVTVKDKKESKDTDNLSEEQARLLAQDICWLRYKTDPDAPPLEDGLPEVDFLSSALALKADYRTIPANLDRIIARDVSVLDGLETKRLADFIHACTQAKPNIPEWTDHREEFMARFKGPERQKRALQGRLDNLNLKYSSSHTVDKLGELLWRHEEGLVAFEGYRDGRALPDRSQEVDLGKWIAGAVGEQMKRASNELKRTLVHLIKTVEDLMATKLEANFLPEYSSLTEAENKDDAVRKKVCGRCQLPLKLASSSFLVVGCGHFLCGQCRPEAGFYCPVQDCPAFIRKRPVLRCSEVPRSSDNQGQGKADYVASFIKDNIPRGDFVVVFAQYRHLIDALAKAFEKAGLSYLNLASTSDAKISDSLENFKAGEAGQILLLDMDSETSAGSNLTIASHVIFANPYVHHDAEHQARTVQQARGRCIRTGQTKKVEVYHFMVPGTIEEETLRKFGGSSSDVQGFFDEFKSIPWWLEEELASDGKAGGRAMVVEEI